MAPAYMGSTPLAFAGAGRAYMGSTLVWQRSSVAPLANPLTPAAARLSFLAATPTGTRKRYVATTGSDGAAGTSAAPYATIGRALGDAQPGDQILVRPGTYGYTRVDGKNGTESAWITIMPENPGDQVNLRVPASNSGTYEIATMINCSFVAFLGLDIAGSGALGADDANADRSGVAVYGGVHHARVWDCHIHDLPGGGINCFTWESSYGGNGKAFDIVDFSYNRIHGTSRRSPSNTSGISINAAQDHTSGATWEDSTGIRIVGNYIYDIICLVPFTPGGYDIVTDGNGISLDLTWDQYGYVKRQLVQDNVIHGCGARAIHGYGVINVDVLHNTVFGNLINSTNSSAIANDPEIDAEDGYIKAQTAAQRASVIFYGNVILPVRYAGSSWKDGQSTYESNVVLAGSGSVGGTNLDRRATGKAYAPGMSDNVSAYIPLQRLAPVTPDQVERHPRAFPTQRSQYSQNVPGRPLVAQRASDGNGTGPRPSALVTLPSKATTGRLLVLTAAWQGQSGGGRTAAPAGTGWTLLHSTPAGLYCSLAVWTKVSNGTETGETVVVTPATAGSNDFISAVMLEMADSGGRINKSLLTAPITSSAATDPLNVSITPELDNVLVLAVLARDGNTRVDSPGDGWEVIANEVPGYHGIALLARTAIDKAGTAVNGSFDMSGTSTPAATSVFTVPPGAGRNYTAWQAGAIVSAPALAATGFANNFGNDFGGPAT